MATILCIDKLKDLKRLANQPWSMSYLNRHVLRNEPATRERLSTMHADHVIVYNVLRDYRDGKLYDTDWVVFATSTKTLIPASKQVIPADGKIKIYGHGYRSGLVYGTEFSSPSAGGLQYWDEDAQKWVAEGIEETVDNLLEFIGEEAADKIKRFDFYSCGSGGASIDNVDYGDSFIKRFREVARYYFHNAYAYGVSGTFTKRYTDGEWSALDPHGRLRAALRSAYYAIWAPDTDTENEAVIRRRKHKALCKVLKLPGEHTTAEAALTAYLRKLDDYERGKGRPKLSEDERAILRGIYDDAATTVAFQVPHGMLFH